MVKRSGMGDKSEINQAPRLEDVRGTRRKDNEVEGSSFEQEPPSRSQLVIHLHAAPF